MIQDILNKYFDGNIQLEDALIQLELKRHELETELLFLKDFKHEKSDDISVLSKEYKEGYNGYRFEVRNGRVTYNYKGIEEWETYDKAKKECEARYKQALISKQKGLLIASKDGEEMQLPEISYGKPSVIIKEMARV